MITQLFKNISELDCTPADEHHLSALPEETDLSALMSDDQHDYMLNREVHRIGVFADQAAGKNPLMEVDHVEKWVAYIMEKNWYRRFPGERSKNLALCAVVYLCNSLLSEKHMCACFF